MDSNLVLVSWDKLELVFFDDFFDDVKIQVRVFFNLALEKVIFMALQNQCFSLAACLDFDRCALGFVVGDHINEYKYIFLWMV